MDLFYPVVVSSLVNFMSKFYQKPVAKGIWLYADSVKKPVYIIEQNYDYWFELGLADDMLEIGETPKLNSDGVVYYLFYGDLPEERPFGIRGEGCFSIEDAKAEAEHELPSSVIWEE